MRCLSVLAVLACAASAEAQPLSWGLNGGSEGWPAGQRDTITRSMNEAVALYNQYGVFEKRLTANYNAGVPTAEANYDGFISFGGQNNTRVALHEMGHTMGVGTYRPFNGGTWDEKGAAGKLLKLFDGVAATLSTGGSHFWPYGLNFDNEDNPGARERHVKLVAALRFDMGIVGDSDRDGMPDDWEELHFDGLTQGADGDPDDDGITNLDEYGSDSDPNVACPVRDGHTYVVRTQASERVLTLQNDLQVKQYVGNPVQHWTARYAGGGFWRFETGGQVLQLEGNDTASGRPLKVGAQSDAESQLWRIVGGIGAKPNYWQLANKATGRLADCLPGGSEDAAVQQWPYVGNIPQQFWTFEDTGSSEGGSKSDASVPSAPDASVPRDAGVRADASVPLRDAGLDAGRIFVDAGEGPGPSEDDGADAPTSERDSGGCALGSSTNASWLLLGLALLLLRRRR
jgi:hypothetical protein